MTEVWNARYGQVVQWDGDPQNAPDRCETCDGTGRVYKIERTNLSCYTQFGSYLSSVGDWSYAYISTDNLPDDIECPECHGHGNIYCE